MGIERRDFLKVSGLAACLALLEPVALSKRALASDGSGGAADFAMVVDVTKCISCWWCYAACKNNRGLPETAMPDPADPPELTAHTWTTLFATEKNGEGWSTRKHACMHCTEASCEQVCPTGAISHQGTAVVIDQEWCVGCGYCVQACPFDVPHKDEHMGTAKKCDLCIDRTPGGELPFCVDACPTGALQFGQRTEMLAAARERVAWLRKNGTPTASLYGETELGGLGVLSILPDLPSAYGLPEEPKAAASKAWAKWLSGIATAGLIAVVPFWFLFRRKTAHQG